MDTAKIRHERFLRAKKAREAKAKNSEFGPIEIPDFEPLLLEPDKCQVFRLVGEVPEDRRNPTDAILVEKSIIKADDGSFFTYIWHPDVNHPFRQLIRKLTKYKYDGKKKIYENEGCELLNRYLTNNKKNPLPYESGMAPSKYVLINAIDRMDDWCKVNKHTKMIAWDVNEVEDKKFYTWGMKKGLFNEIFDVKCGSIGTHYEYIDLVVRRFSKNTKPADDIFYQVIYNEEKRAIQNWSNKDGIDYQSFIVNSEDLSKEEMAYERYNLENIPFVSMPTPVGVIMNKLETFIKKADKKYGWNTWEAMVEWNAKEIAELKAHNQEHKEDHSEVSFNTSKSHVVTETEEEEDAELPTKVETPVNKVQKKVVKEKKVDFTEEMYEMFPGLSECPEHIKKHITFVDVENEIINFDIESDARCGECENDIPDEFDYCPYCGTQY